MILPHSNAWVLRPRQTHQSFFHSFLTIVCPLISRTLGPDLFLTLLKFTVKHMSHWSKVIFHNQLIFKWFYKIISVYWKEVENSFPLGCCVCLVAAGIKKITAHHTQEYILHSGICFPNSGWGMEIFHSPSCYLVLMEISVHNQPWNWGAMLAFEALLLLLCISFSLGEMFRLYHHLFCLCAFITFC